MRSQPKIEVALHEGFAVARYEWEPDACWDRPQAVTRIGSVAVSAVETLLASYNGAEAPDVEIVIRLKRCPKP